MAKAKRKTLPKDFKEIVKCGNPDEIKAVFERCDINAYDNGTDRRTALMLPELQPEMIRWLVDQSADINWRDKYYKTPLHIHAYFKSENIPLLLELGAELDTFAGEFGETPLHYVVGGIRPEGVRVLLEYGADPEICCGWFHDNALMHLVRSCRGGGYIPPTVEIAEMLLARGMEITEKMRDEVTRIGTDFEFFRRDFNPDYLEETDAALQRLYQMFGAAPVPRRELHMGDTPLKVKGRTWQKQYQSLWDQLVPGIGHAETVQGEAVRLIGRLANEVLEQGGCNWDADFRKMVNAFAGYLGTGTPADADTITRAKKLSPDTDEDEFAYLTEQTVKWVANNPTPIPLEKTDYKR